MVLACDVPEHLDGDELTEHLLHEGIGELIMACLHRRVSGEDAKVAHARHVPDRPFVPYTLDVAFEPEKQFESEKGGVPLVHMVFLDMELKGVEHPYAAHAEDDLLLDPVVQVAAVEVIGDAPVRGSILRKVRIQEEDGNFAARGAYDRIHPCLDIHVPALDGHFDLFGQKGHIPCGVPGHRFSSCHPLASISWLK